MLGLRVQDYVDAHLYSSEEEVIQEALRHLLQNRPELRIALAVHHYQTDEEISLARAAYEAGVSSERMKDILVSRGVQPRLGSATLEEAQKEVETARRWVQEELDQRGGAI